MTIINVIIALIILSLMVYTFILFFLGFYKMSSLIVYSLNRKSKKIYIGSYLKLIFVDNVTKNISQVSLVITSVGVAIIILIVIFVK